jgi:hypothetical protein
MVNSRADRASLIIHAVLLTIAASGKWQRRHGTISYTTPERRPSLSLADARP